MLVEVLYDKIEFLFVDCSNVLCRVLMQFRLRIVV